MMNIAYSREVLTTLLLLLTVPASSAIWYADRDAPPGGDGTSWATAFDEIQPAIDTASSDGGGEVWVAEGIYDEVRGGENGALILAENVLVYGGFVGTEEFLEQRDYSNYRSVIDGSQSFIGQPVSAVVRAASDTQLDGFTVTGGISHGILAWDVVHFNISNCIVTGIIKGTLSGAGIRIVYGGEVQIHHCTIENNTTLGLEAGGTGIQVSECVLRSNVGGIASFGSDLIVRNCILEKHTASAVALYPSSGIRFEACTLRENVGRAGAAVLFFDEGLTPDAVAPEFVNCLFLRNIASDVPGLWLCPNVGGAVYCYLTCSLGKKTGQAACPGAKRGKLDILPSWEVEGYEPYEGGECISRTPRLINCTFVGNRSDYGGAVFYCYTDEGFGAIDARISNCIFWDNGDTPIGGHNMFWSDGSSDVVTYSIVEGGFPGTGNLDLEPRFREAANDDYRLVPDSPAIDQGRDTSTAEFGGVVDDFRGCPRGGDGDGLGAVTGDGSEYDIGAYEYAPGCPLPPGLHTADRNENGRIDLSELLRIIQFYNSGGFHCAEDLGLTEDGYLPGPGANQSCTPHDSDYSVSPDWTINFDELLRIIQFFNSGGYHVCEGSEDGFCTGPE